MIERPSAQQADRAPLDNAVLFYLDVARREAALVGDLFDAGLLDLFYFYDTAFTLINDQREQGLSERYQRDTPKPDTPQ